MGSGSIHERYRERLSRLAAEVWSIETIRFAVERWPDWNGSRQWEPCYGRFEPGRAPYAQPFFNRRAKQRIFA